MPLDATFNWSAPLAAGRPPPYPRPVSHDGADARVIRQKPATDAAQLTMEHGESERLPPLQPGAANGKRA